MKNRILRDPCVGFVIRFVLIFGLLIAPWPGWNLFYGQYFRDIGRMTFESVGGRRIVLFSPIPQSGSPSLDTRMSLANRELIDDQGKGLLKQTDLDTRAIGWLPTALTIGLILATPIPWGRRILALLAGLLLVHGFILFSLQSQIWSCSPDVSLLTLTPFWKNAADELSYTLVNQIGPSFSVPVLIWILVTFRRKDRLIDNDKRSIAGA